MVLHLRKVPGGGLCLHLPQRGKSDERGLPWLLSACEKSLPVKGAIQGFGDAASPTGEQAPGTLARIGGPAVVTLGLLLVLGPREAAP